MQRTARAGFAAALTMARLQARGQCMQITLQRVRCVQEEQRIIEVHHRAVDTRSSRNGAAGGRRRRGGRLRNNHMATCDTQRAGEQGQMDS